MELPIAPVNLVLLVLFSLLLYARFRPAQASPAILPPTPAATVFRIFTPPQLLEFDGRDGRPVYLAVRGKVFDVTPGRNFYGPGGPYENFAGRDASRGLACNSFSREMLTSDLNGPLDQLEDLGTEEMSSLRGWEERFDEKYLVVGKLVAVNNNAEIE
ncbi:cytochrome b5 [Piedraia hortae CBS 480.64]|uniref:Cytochrome b5 n=1 Tax=Piedraia hortae CBS 480.64 TaxID=1314780 RepID=A0A6A7BYZ3_9PEZI|nr:cytochrome b5 [Piedraia hortae CBS 480.64]